MTKEQTICFSEDECCTLRQVEYTSNSLRDKLMHIPMAKIHLKILKDSFEKIEKETQRSLNLINQAIRTLGAEDRDQNNNGS